MLTNRQRKEPKYREKTIHIFTKYKNLLERKAKGELLNYIEEKLLPAFERTLIGRGVCLKTGKKLKS